MKIFVLICANGLGHYKRCIEILYALKCSRPEVSITVSCETWQIDRMKNWEISEKFWRSKSVKHSFEPREIGVKWNKDPGVYKSQILIEWHKALRKNSALKEADLVISDNLSQILHYRKDALLMGSFLWSDILSAAYSDNEDVKKFVEEELKLLSIHHPPMICLNDMVMPAVLQKTVPVRMPWFCDKKNHHKELHYDIPKIAILGGATESLHHQLLELAQILSATGKYKIFLPDQQASKLNGYKNIELFDFKDETFLQLSAIICRPGIGALTDGIRFSVPLITLYEQDNLEMMHNSNKVQELKIGINLGTGKSTTEMVEDISDFIGSNYHLECKKSIKERPANGISETVNWILKHYN